MKRTLLCFLFSAALCSVVSAQSNLTSVTYNKVSQPGLMIELPYNEDVSEGFITSNLKKIGYDVETKGALFWKNNKQNGFLLFKGVRLQGTAEPLDLYFRVERKSKQEKNQSIIYMLMSRGGENFVPSTEDSLYAAGKNFLNSFPSQSASYKLDLDIKAQEETLKNAEKKLSRLKDDQRSLEKKIDNLQSDLKKNAADQQSQQKTIENEQKKLADLKAKVNAG